MSGAGGPMAAVARMVDVYVLRPGEPAPEVLLLRRALGVRCPGSWEAVHGHVEAGETPVAAALREVREETGVDVERLYNLSRLESFYLHRTDQIALVPAFAAFVASGANVHVSGEHDAFRWASLTDAEGAMAWPRERRALADLRILLGTGDAGPLEDVLRVVLPPPGDP